MVRPIPLQILSGQVKVVCAMDRVTNAGNIHLQDGKVLTQVDHVLFGTGYRYSFSNIDPDILSSDPKSGKLELYKMAFPLSLEHDSLALVGCARVSGPVPPLLELQARLVARVFAGRHQLPGREERQRDVDQLNRWQLQHNGYYKYVFPIMKLAEEVATVLGVKPDWWRLLLEGDVKMASAVMLGPAYPFHYRLQGPHPWGGAREATLKAYQQTVYSMQHRQVGSEKGRKENQWGRFWLVFVSVAVVCYLWMRL